MALIQKKTRLLPFIIPVILALIFFSLTSLQMRRAPWYEEAFWNLVSPPQQFVSGIIGGVKGAWQRYVSLIGVEEERAQLSRRVAELEGSLMRLGETEEENKRLRALLDYKESLPQKTAAARVIANDPRAEFKSITIDKGSNDGVQPLMAVLGPRGLVGRVGTVTAGYSRVLLLTDPNSSIDAMVQRSRARGVVQGAAWRTELKTGFYIARLEYLRRVSDIRDGDVVVTSGLDRVFPAGIPIGTVTDISASRYGVFTEANIIPFENMAELQEVLVILSTAEQSSPDFAMER
ncbi:MAG: rod shape-determining protein MreC [bacterium]